MAKSEGYLLSCPEFTLFSLGGKKIAEDVLSALWVEIGFDWDDIIITKAQADISFHKDSLVEGELYAF